MIMSKEPFLVFLYSFSKLFHKFIWPRNGSKSSFRPVWTSSACPCLSATVTRSCKFRFFRFSAWSPEGQTWMHVMEKVQRSLYLSLFDKVRHFPVSQTPVVTATRTRVVVSAPPWSWPLASCSAVWTSRHVGLSWVSALLSPVMLQICTGLYFENLSFWSTSFFSIPNSQQLLF